MPNKYLDSVGLAEYTTLIKTALDDKLPLSGGAITGNLSVSGTITGNVTGNVTGNADTATNATNATKATNDGNGNPIASTYLPLSGGTMTGTILHNNSVALARTTNDSYLYFYGGTATNNDGARLTLTGKNHSWAGGWQLTADDGTNNKTLLGSADGTLTWNGSNVITSAGGTLTGNIHFNKGFPYIGGNLTDGSMSVLAGANVFDGATLQLFGRNDSTYAGRFYLRASTKSGQSDSSGSECVLAGRPDGTLTWGGTSISLSGHTHSYLPLSGGTMTGEIIRNTYVVKNSVDNGYTKYLGGKDETSSHLVLYGKNHSNTPGRINLRAIDGTNNSYLTLDPNGSATWGGHQLERVNSSGSNYIRFESGLQICWGQTSTIASATTLTITFPASFVDTNARVTIGRVWVPSAENYYLQDITKTNFKLTAAGTVGSNNHNYQYIAVGKWK